MLTYKGEEKKRDPNIDLLKGVFVIFMVLYHSASIATELSPGLLGITDVLSFLHYAFLLITGFLCGWHYFPGLRYSPKKTRFRIRIRAIKLLAILIISNAIFYSIGLAPRLAKLRELVSSPSGIIRNFVFSINGGAVAFEVLYYISIFLLLASFFIGRINPYLIIGILLFGQVLLPQSATLFYISFGFLGMLLGIKVIKGTIGINILAGITKYTVPVGLIIYLLFRNNLLKLLSSARPLAFILYVIEQFLWFFSVMVLAKLLLTHSFREGIASFGKYTLFAYIIQMPLIRIGYLFFSDLGVTNYAYYFATIALVSISLYLLLLLIGVLRLRFPAINDAYRFVFQ